MKILTRTVYKAVDGAEFDNKEECIKYEELIKAVNSIMSKLPPKPKDDTCSFSNGEGYIQHSDINFNKVRLELLELMRLHIKSDWIQQNIDDSTIHSSWIGCLLDENREVEPIRRAWFRISCTDSKYREWGQGYYAEHPEKGNHIKLN